MNDTEVLLMVDDRPSSFTRYAARELADRLVLLPAPLPAYPSGELRGIRTRFGAEIDLTWSPDAVTAVVRPTRTHSVELRTSSGVQSLGLVAGEARVIGVDMR